MEEAHDSQSAGCWCPPELLEALSRREISRSDISLLLIIDSLTSTKSDCFASNDYLGNRCGVSAKQISRSISQLIQKGYLAQTDFDGRKRYLAPLWRLALKGTAKSRRAYAKMRSQHTQKCVVSTPDTILVFNNTLSEVPDGTWTASDSEGKKGKRHHPRWRRFAEQLNTAISTIHKVNKTSQLSSWATSFRLLHQVDKVTIPKIRAVLGWYCRQMPNQDQYTPVAHSGATFREKFVRIQAAMDRARKEEAEDPMDLPPKGPPPGRKIVGRMSDKEFREKFGEDW